ncbi:hypothetical protein ABZV91_19375 [Nocardia sp. NPDC004568]|uniref:hypothetical protein n=1 Tax=Nocardia sp. NPDC004568 TaxID=3154551 RepID=UPI0033B55688
MGGTVNLPSSRLADALSFCIDKGPYRYNAFRLDARSIHELATTDDESVSTRTGPVLPVGHELESESVHQAVSLMAVPEYRLIYELFWFWPAIPQDQALDHLAEGDIAAARRIWEEHRGGSGPAAAIAVHNLAVLTQLEASESSAGDTWHAWLNAVELWDETLRMDAFWQHVAARMSAIDEFLGRSGDAELRRILPGALLRLFAQFILESIRQNEEERLNAQIIAFDEVAVQDSDPASAFPKDLIEAARQRLAREIADEFVGAVAQIADLYRALTTDTGRIGQAIADANFVGASIRGDLGFIEREITGVADLFDRDALEKLTAMVLLDIGDALLERARMVIEAVTCLSGRATAVSVYRCVWHMTVWCNSEASHCDEVTVFREGLMNRARSLVAGMITDLPTYPGEATRAPLDIVFHIAAIDSVASMTRNMYVHDPDGTARNAAQIIELVAESCTIPVRELRALGHPADERIRRIFQDLALDMMVTLAGHLRIVGNRREYARLYRQAELVLDADLMREALETLSDMFPWGRGTSLVEVHRRAVRGGMTGLFHR